MENQNTIALLDPPDAPVSIDPILDKPRVLAIEDDPPMGELIRTGLEKLGNSVVLVGDAERGLALLRKNPFDIILLDWNLPGLDGGEFLRLLRQFSRVPVIIESGNKDLEFRLKAFEMGADDIVAKPFSVRELHSRIRAILRRIITEVKGSQVQVGDVTIDLDQQKVLKGGKPVALPAKEFEIIRFLLQAPGRPVAKELINRVLFPDRDVDSSNRCDVFIYRIRKKLGKDFIRSTYGIGYTIDLESPQRQDVAEISMDDSGT